MMTRLRPLTLAAGLVFAAASCTPSAPSTAPAPATTPATAPAGGAQGAARPATPNGPQAGGAQDPQPRPYDQVIRGTVTTKQGLFKTHQIGSQLYYEIPAAEMGRDLLLVTQIAKTNEGDGYGGQALDQRVVRWERRGNRVLFRSVSYAIVSDPRRRSPKRWRTPTTTPSSRRSTSPRTARTRPP
jgi:hypothetical protein